MQKLLLIISFTLLLGASTNAIACGGHKAHTKYHKGKAAVTCMAAKCMKEGSCTDPTCMKDGKCTKGTTSKAPCMKAASAGMHHCCMGKANKS